MEKVKGNDPEEQQYQKMIETPIPKLIMSLAVPVMVSMLLSSTYSLVDTFFVSKLGTSPAGATGIVFSIMAMIQAVGFTVGMGAGSTISRVLGKKKEEEANEIAASSFVTALLLGVLLTAAGLLFLKPLLLFLGATETILPYAMEYGKYILYTAPVMTGTFVLDNLLKAEGKTTYAMWGIVIGSILNMALDPVLIFWMGLGIKGAGIATVISQWFGFFILLLYYIRKKTILNISIKRISRKFETYKTFLVNGMPSLFRQGLASAAAIALNRTASTYGDSAVAAMSIVGKVFLVVFCVMIGFGQGFQPVAGYNFGAKEYERLRKAYRFLLITGTVAMTAAGAILYFITPWLIGNFIAKDPEVTAIGIRALRWQCFVFPLLPIGIACNLTFQAVGKPVLSTFLASCRQGICYLPLIFLLPHFMGLFGIILAQPIADILTFLICLPFSISFLRGLKKKKS